MVNSRLYICPASRAHEMKLRCRFYASHGSKPIFTSLGARCDRCGSRYAYLESLLDDAALQPYVHDCLLTVKERNRLHRFRIFFKRHVLLPLNGAVQSLGTAAFKGDVVIARVAVRDEVSLINMRARDGILADFAMRKFVRYAKAIRARQIPRCLTFAF